MNIYLFCIPIQFFESDVSESRESANGIDEESDLTVKSTFFNMFVKALRTRAIFLFQTKRFLDLR